MSELDNAKTKHLTEGMFLLLTLVQPFEANKSLEGCATQGAALKNAVESSMYLHDSTSFFL